MGFQISPGSAASATPIIQSHLDRFQNELKDKTERLGADHPDVAGTLVVIGLVYQHLVNDRKTAMEYHKEALRILEKEVQDGNESHEIIQSLAATLADTAYIHEANADYDHALDSFKQAEALLRAIDRPEEDHVLLASSLGSHRISRIA